MGDPEPMSLVFNEEAHEYRLDGVPIPSVSRLLDRIKPPFDAPAAAARVGRRDGIDPAELLRQWEEKRDKACAFGHLIHAAIEGHLRGTPIQGGPPQLRHWLKWWEAAKEHLMPFRIEHRMASAELRVAGTCDLIADSSKTGMLHPLDYKTNGEFETFNRFRNLLAPFDDLDASDLNIYSAQISIYRVLAEEEFKWRKGSGSGWLLHLSETGITPHRCRDLRARVRPWLRTLAEKPLTEAA